MEYLDIVDEEGIPTGQTIEREVAHRKGIRHRTGHVWIMRKNKKGAVEILLQKRSDNKDSFPGCFDISSAGHIPAGEEVIPSALRELWEELGLSVLPEELIYCGKRSFENKNIFHGKAFWDRQVSSVFVLWKNVDIKELHLQKEEIADAVWMELEACIRAVQENSIKHCIAMEELLMLRAEAAK